MAITRTLHNSTNDLTNNDHIVLKYSDQWEGVKSRSDFRRNAKCFEANNRPEGDGRAGPDNGGKKLGQESKLKSAMST
ncbi:hypothetical protein DERP_000811 [Dermatophagoides pteronyssinus]|uniref:Uncharacterized protein n=1 Tax=Dermatophagoides pteronyssinus TaxID=6956 RepID=A0ABQ8J1R6_DERPT|nr:hypothetical protein DERP_000811 [Dermatophagoides pteronyssinus]